MSTELVDPRFAQLDEWPTAQAVEVMLDEQAAAIATIRSQTGAIAAAAEAAAERLGNNGRLVYAGAGTSGRIAVQDGVELQPTFNWPGERLVFLMAGGLAALVESAEGAEDDAADAIRLVSDCNLRKSDVVIGVAASGSTPFTCAALEAARDCGALTVGIANNAGSRLVSDADFGICAITGSEVVAGSTRMKAGTAQKAILNVLSTSVMLRRGLVYQGLMVNMRISNEKLLVRGRAIVGRIAGVDPAAARSALEETDLEIGAAILVAMGTEPTDAKQRLALHGGNLKEAIAAMQSGD